MKKRLMLIYPPGRLFQRGEERCQSNIEESASTTMRACNDLGYVAAVAKDYKIFLKDYQTESLSFSNLTNDFLDFCPDALFISTTNTTVFSDIDIARKLKKLKKDCVVILKGAIFFNPSNHLLNQLNLEEIDYLIGGEAEFVISDLLDFHFFGKGKIDSIGGILYKKDKSWIRTDFSTWEENLDALPFPNRALMYNSLYVRPDTSEPQATITTSRGCPANCIFCLTPTISGKRLRLRSPFNIFNELLECYSLYNIRNFFFKSDTFTINQSWVVELCNLIINSKLFGKISWVANSRAKPLEIETLKAMKKAGCWLVAFGFESGSDETLKKVRKATTTIDNLKAAKMAKEAGLKIFGFFVIGFPWEDRTHLQETKKHIFEIDSDFIELHLAIPYYGSELYNIAKSRGLLKDSILGADYFNPPTIGTEYLTLEELVAFKKKIILRYHFRLSYITKKLIYAIGKPKVLKNYFKFGWRLLFR